MVSRHAPHEDPKEKGLGKVPVVLTDAVVHVLIGLTLLAQPIVTIYWLGGEARLPLSIMNGRLLRVQ